MSRPIELTPFDIILLGIALAALGGFHGRRGRDARATHEPQVITAMVAFALRAP